MPTRRGKEYEVVVVTIPWAILGGQNMGSVREELFRLVEERDRLELVLDFRNVEYVSSEALGPLITLHKKLEVVGGRLVLCHLDPQIYEVFEITKLDRYFVIVDDPAFEQRDVEIVPTPRKARKHRWDGEPIILPFPPPDRQ